MKSVISKRHKEIQKEVYKMLLSLKLITGKEEWYPSFNKDNITIFSNKKQTLYTKEIRICVNAYEIGNSIRKKYDVMRWNKKDHYGKIIYNLKEKIFKDEMDQLINGD